MNIAKKIIVLFFAWSMIWKPACAQPGGIPYIPIAVSFNITDSTGHAIHFSGCHFPATDNQVSVGCTDSSGKWKLEYFPLDTSFKPVYGHMPASKTTFVNKPSSCLLMTDTLAIAFSIDSVVQINFRKFSTHCCRIINGSDTMTIIFYDVPFEQGVLFFRYRDVRFRRGIYKIDLRKIARAYPIREYNIKPDFNKDAIEVVPPVEKKKKKKKNQ